MTTITANSTIGVVLTSPLYSNPVVINPGVVISSGAYGVYATSGSWTLVNGGSIAAARSGVRLDAGGGVTNAVSASITGVIFGVEISGSAGTLVNYGSIAGTGAHRDGIALLTGGSVTNAASASIKGDGFGIFIGNAGTVVNDGSIASTGGFIGVILVSGGSVTNAASASITGTALGVMISADSGTVVNNGSIAATGTAFSESGYLSAGLSLSAGSVTNAVSASISGYDGIDGGAVNVTNFGSIMGNTIHGIGVDLSAGGTLRNAGTISGSTGAAFGGTGSNLLVVDPGFGFSGLVTGSTSASNTLELASAASAGTVAGLGTQFTNFGPIKFDAGAKWSITGDTSGLAGTISDFAAGDTIVLSGVTATGSSYVGGILTLDETSGSATLDLPGTFTIANFDVTPGVSGGTEVTFVPCFCSGTRLLTGSGEVAVEALKPGDHLQTLREKGLAPIIWIGQRRVDCRRHPNPQDVWPVRVTAGAFGDGLPARDLRLSPDHAVYIDGVLIPIRYLVNGATIVQEQVEEVTYWHVELPQHGVILAEGLPCESYLDTGNRGAFTNGGSVVQMHPDFALSIWEAKACAPLVRDGAELEAARSYLLERAELLGFATTRDPALRLVAGGHAVQPEIIGRVYRFYLPAIECRIRLVSRSAIPAFVRADSVDHRRLGVAVSCIKLDGHAIPLSDGRLRSGWHEVESPDADTAWRWTDGDAGLALAGVHVLEVEVAMTERYWVEREASEERAA